MQSTGDQVNSQTQGSAVTTQKGKHKSRLRPSHNHKLNQLKACFWNRWKKSDYQIKHY